MATKKSFRARIRALLKHMTVEELAVALEVSTSSIFRWKRLEMKKPRMALERRLGVVEQQHLGE